MTRVPAVHISSLSYAYPEVDGETRAAIARRLGDASAPGDTLVLSTCLRVEVVTAGDREQLLGANRVILGNGLGASVRGKLRVDGEAVAHLARVAAGLESPMVGEREILTQFRLAVHDAEESGRLGGVFVRLLENLVSIGRQARELLPDLAHASMAAVATQVVGFAPRVAVLGSGVMASAVVAGLQALPAPPAITLVARSPEKVTIENVEVWPFNRAVETVAQFPAVISATSAKHRPVADGDLVDALAARSTRLVLVDMAMPPDFLPSPDAPVDYFDIDDLAALVARRPRGEQADEMVANAAAEAYRQYADHNVVGPVISGLITEADLLVERTVERFGGRLSSDGDRALLRQAAHTVARGLLARPVEHLKQTEHSGEIDVIARAFGLDRD